MEQRGFKGVWIPKEIWLDERLNALDKVILAEIDSLDNEDGCWAGNDYFAKFCQCSESKVSRSIANLIACGCIRIDHFDGRRRYLRSCLGNLTRLPRQFAEAESANLQAINIRSNTPIIPLDVEVKGVDTVQRYATDNLAYLSPTAMQELASFLEDVPDDLVRYAIDLACEQNKRTWAYTKSILNRWVADGIRTVGEAKAAADKFRAAQNKPSPQDKPAKRKDWDEMTEEERKKALASGPFGKWVD